LSWYAACPARAVLLLPLTSSTKPRVGDIPERFITAAVPDPPFTGDTPCRSTNVDYRLDTASARSFLSSYVALP
jgi:hypothetical protein